MADVVISGKILQWGNSYGIRLKKSDLEKLGLKPGADVTVKIEDAPGRIDLSHIPTFSGGRPDDSERHDELLGEYRWKRHLERTGQSDDAGR